MIKMFSRNFSLVIALVMLAPAVFPAAVAQAVPDPTGGILPEVVDALPLGLNATVAEALEGRMISLFKEDFEGTSTLASRGWREDILLNRQNVSTVWHLDTRDEAAATQGRPTAVVSSGNRSLSISTGVAYPQDLNHRVVSPVIDLRYVSGAAAKTDTAYDTDYAALLKSSPLGEFLTAANAVPGSLAGIVQAVNDALVTRVSGSSTAVSRFGFVEDWFTTRPSDVPVTGSSFGLGYVNLSFRHFYDFAPGHGGYVEIRTQDASGAWSQWSPLDGDLIFETEIDWVALLDEFPACRGEPVKAFTTGNSPPYSTLKNTDATYLCAMARYYDQSFNRTRVYNADTGRYEPGPAPSNPFPPFPSIGSGGSPSNDVSVNPYYRTYRSPVSVTDLYELLAEGQPAEPYTGSVNNTRAFQGKSYRDSERPLDQPIVGDIGLPLTDVPITANQGHSVVKSTFTLNRFIGEKVQIGFRVEGKTNKFDNYRGWFLDDVQVMAVVPDRDIAMDESVTPASGGVMDTLAPGLPFVPTIKLKNFGREEATGVSVNFSITDAQGNAVGYAPHIVTLPLAIKSLETVSVPASKAFTPTVAGGYILHATASIASDSPAGAEDGSTANNALAVPFKVATVDDIVMRVVIPETSAQTDVGASKTFSVRLENRGNRNIGGTLRVTVAKWDGVRNERIGEVETLEPTESAFISPSELPYGKNVSAQGVEKNWVTRTYTWTNTDEAGVYLVTAVLEREGASVSAPAAYLLVRQSPPPYFSNTFENQRTSTAEIPYPASSVELLSPYEVLSQGAGWRTRSNYYSFRFAQDTPTAQLEFPGYRANYPPALGGNGVWEATGKDGPFGPPQTSDFERSTGYKANSNYLDLYPLEIAETFTLGAGVATKQGRFPVELEHVNLEFYQWNRFAWIDGEGKDEARGILCIVNMTRQAGPSNIPACDGRLADVEETPAGDLTAGDPIRIFDTEANWKLETVSLDAYIGYNVRIQFILQSSANRGYTDDYAGRYIPPTASEPSNNAPGYCNPDFACDDLKAGRPLMPWLLDEIRLVGLDKKGVRHVVFFDGAEANLEQAIVGAKGDSLKKFTNCFERDSASLMCRGWVATNLLEQYPSAWHLEEGTGFVPPGVLADTRSSLRWGIKDQQDYGNIKVHIQSRYGKDDANCQGASGEAKDFLKVCYVYGVAESPSFKLDSATSPLLKYWTQYEFVEQVAYDQFKPGNSSHVQYEWDTNGGVDSTDGRSNGLPSESATPYARVTLDGANTWIVGRDATGRVVVRDLLFPEGGYDARLASKQPGDKFRETNHEVRFFLSPEFKLMSTRYESDLTGFAGRSGRAVGEEGDALWVEKRFDLSQYATPVLRNLDYTLEFQAVRQHHIHAPSFGWRVDDVQIIEGEPANDVALVGIQNPAKGRVLGPGMEIPIVVTTRNEGLYDQKGVNVTYIISEIVGSSRILVHGPLSENTGFLTDADAIPGLLNENEPDKNRTVVFSKTWIVPELGPGISERRYVLEAYTDLATGIFPFIDDNRANDRFSQEIIVRETRSSRIAGRESVADDVAVSPPIAPTGQPRTFVARVENIGTLAEIYDFRNPQHQGEFKVVIDITDEAGRLVLDQPLTREISELAAADSVTLRWDGAWTPTKSGLYTITMTLIHPNESYTGDNRRVIKHEVFDKFFPGITSDGTDEPIASLFESSDDGWTAEYARIDGGLSFSDGTTYLPNKNSTLTLIQDLNLKSLRQAFIRVNHSYSLEETFDGGILEVSTDGGVSWELLTPLSGYPTVMSTASPLVVDPLKEVRAFSGDSGGFMFSEFNLGKLPQLQTRALLFNDSFDTNRYPQIAGNWTTTSSTVRPPTGGSMLFSNKTVMKCWKDQLDGVTTGAPVKATASSANGFHGVDSSELGQYYGDVVDTSDCLSFENANTMRYTTKKYLNLTLPTQDLVADPGARLVVSYWDWRAIGLQLVEGEGSVFLPPLDTNGVKVEICCTTDDPNDPDVILEKSRSNAYADNYRDWTRNEFIIPNLVQKIAQKEHVNVSFIHTVANGERSFQLKGSIAPDGHPVYWDTDFLSPHMGWAIDDIQVKVIYSDGRIVSVYENPVDYVSTQQAKDEKVQGAYWTTRQEDKKPNVIAGVSVGPNRLTWKVVPGIYFEDTWSYVTVPGRGTVAYAQPIKDDVAGVTGGNYGRLVSRVDLKAAVDDVVLSIDHAYKFSESGVDRAHRGPVSGGRFEVSTDEGRTWVPVDPLGGYSRDVRRYYPAIDGTLKADGVEEIANAGSNSGSAHTIFGVDPEGNSPFGPGGSAFWGMNELPSGEGGPGNKPELYDWKQHALWKTDKFDISEFAGKEIWISFNVGFHTLRDVKGELRNDKDFGRRADFWAIDNVRIEAAVFDGKDAKVRLRAVSDSNVETAGWDVQSVELLGVKHLVNVAARIVEPKDGDLVAAERPVPFQVLVVNKGQDPLFDVLVTVDRRALSAEPDSTNWTRIERAPLTNFGPCPGETLDATGMLAAESSVRLCSYLGVPLTFYAFGGIAYSLFAEAEHDALNLEVVVGDNAGSTLISNAVPYSQVLLKDLVVSPNAYDERVGGPVTIKAVVVNEGVDEVSIRELEILISGRDVAKGMKPIRLDLATAEPKSIPVLKRAREERTYTWVLDERVFRDLVDGHYNVNATVLTACSTGCQGVLTHKLSSVAYFGTNYFDQYLANGRQYNSGGPDVIKDQPPAEAPPPCGNPTGEDCPAGESEPCASRQEWRRCGSRSQSDLIPVNTGRWSAWLDMSNHTPRYGFGVEATQPMFLCDPPPSSEATSGPCKTNARSSVVLVSPMLSLNDTILADGTRTAFLSYWERLDSGANHFVRILARPMDAKSNNALSEAPQAGAPERSSDNFAPWVVVANLTGTVSPGFAAGAFVPRTYNIVEAIDRAFATEPYQKFQPLLNVYSGVQVAFEIGFVDQRFFGGWYVDDVTLSPLGFSVKPAQSYPVTDFADKMYKYVVANDGAFTDRYAVSVKDGAGGQFVPPHWVVSASRYNAERGVIEVFDESGDAARCAPLKRLYDNVDPDAPVVRVSSFTLERGESTLVNLRVCVPILENLAGRTGQAPVPFQVKSLTMKETAAANDLTLTYAYLTRPNLFLDPRPDVGLRVNNADLPVNQPRSVEVLVRNTGQNAARNVLVDVIAVPDPALGAANETLTRVDGSAIQALAVIPPGEGRTFTLLWTPKTVGEYTLIARADPKDTVIELSETDNLLTRTLSIGRASFPDLEVRAVTSTLQPNVGDEVRVSASITNHGGVPASGVQVNFKIGVTDLLPQAPFFLPRAIAPGETVWVNKTWTAVFPGKVLVFVSAIPRGGTLERVETQDDNLFVEALLVRSLGLDLGAAKGLALLPGSGGRTPLVLGNGGETADAYNLDVNAPAGIGAFLELEGRRVTSLALTNGSSETLSLVVDVPFRAPAGNYSIAVRASSQNTSQAKTIDVPIQVLAEYGLALDGKIIDVRPGKVTIPLTARNLGNAVDGVRVEVTSGLRPGWTATSKIVDLAPYGGATVSLVLDIPTRELQGVYDLVVRVVDARDYDAHARVTIEIGNLERVIPGFESESVDVRPATSVPFDVSVANEGNVRAEAALRALAPEGWTVEITGPRAVVLEPGESTRVPVTLRVPERTKVGEYALSLVATGLESVGRGEVAVRVRGSDLTFADVDFAPRVNLKSGTAMNFTAEVENIGGILASNVSVAFYVDDALIGFEVIPALAPGKSSSVRFPWEAVAGSHSVVVVIDPGLELEEEDENNNARVLDVRVAAEEDFLAAAKNAVPGPTGLLLIGALLGVALGLRRRRK